MSGTDSSTARERISPSTSDSGISHTERDWKPALPALHRGTPTCDRGRDALGAMGAADCVGALFGAQRIGTSDGAPMATGMSDLPSMATGNAWTNTAPATPIMPLTSILGWLAASYVQAHARTQHPAASEELPADGGNLLQPVPVPTTATAPMANGNPPNGIPFRPKATRGRPKKNTLPNSRNDNPSQKIRASNFSIHTLCIAIICFK